MVQDLFINAMILISFISIATQIFREESLSKDSSIKVKVVTGVICGLLSILLMIYTVEIDKSIFVDFRNIPLILIAVKGSTITTFIAAVMIGLFRFLNFGINTPSAIGLLSALLMGIGLSIIGSSKINTKRKWIFSVTYSLLVSSTLLIILLFKSSNLINSLIVYCISTIIISFLVYYFNEYFESMATLYRKYKKDSFKDFLTGLNNVRSFDSIFNSLAENAALKGEKLSLLYIDIDFFKKVNDTYGHSNGDVILRELALILTTTCRSFDIVSRNGGEEFSVILLDCPSDYAVKIGEKIRKNVEENLFTLLSGEKIKITISVGIATYPDTTTDTNVLIEQADTALYNAKKTGRNKVLLFS
ncbi:diguanylate cyclase [Candidatus Clostridium stratigraminis]|uniref:Diguanylate cyclase n=1 Tax=Candidatus Clostridium stratigraminis TaxID=3381661 RepID=A0ABW8T505_9CLOT